MTRRPGARRELVGRPGNQGGGLGRAAGLLAVLLAGTPGFGIDLPPGLGSAVVVRGLREPTAAAFAPDGRLLVLEKGGAVRLWTPDAGLQAAPLIELPTCTRSEMGLLGLAFDPAFGENGHLYLYGTHPPGGDPARCEEGSAAGRENRVVRLTLSGGVIDPASLVVIFDGIATDGGNHDGGDVHVGPDGFLYVAPGDTGRGDFGNPGDSTNPYARDLTRPEGKVLRMTLTGEPAPGNPFLGRGGAADFVFASGFRNPFRFTFDPRTGLLWVADVGQHTFEEIDVVHPGDDLGWPQCEGPAPSPPCPGDTVPPVYAYGHDGDDAAITGGVVYDGDRLGAAYRGGYFFGDYVLGTIWYAPLDATRTGFAADPEVFATRARGPVSFSVGPDGALYYVAIAAGQVLRIAGTGGDGARCGRQLARAARRWILQVGRAVDRCVVSGGTGCGDGVAAPRVRRRVRRALAPRCSPTDAASACAALGCGGCAGPDELAACVAAAARDVAAGLGTRVHAALGGRCARAASRGGARAAGARVVAVARCQARGGDVCTPLPDARRVRRLASCRSEAAAACEALGCAVCGGVGDLGSCLGAIAVEHADALTARLPGVP